MDRFLAMKVFAHVVEAGSFPKAADALRLLPASVSRILQALEAHLGARLINRTTRSISITEDDEAYYERCVRVLGEVDDMEASLSHSKLSPKGNVKISLPQVMAKSTIIPVLQEFFAAHPDIGIELLLTDRQVDLVEEGVDCVVRVGAVGDVGLVAKRIGAYSQITCALPRYIEQFGDPMTPDDLEHHLAIGYVLSNSGRVHNWEFDVDGKARILRDEAQDRGQRRRFVYRGRRGGPRPDPEFELYARSAAQKRTVQGSADGLSVACARGVGAVCG